MKNIFIIVLLVLTFTNNIGYARDVISITAKNLSSEYDANEIAGDKKYKGKRLLIKGVVDEVSKDIMGDVYVSLVGMNEMQVVQCYFEDGDKLDELSKGDVVLIEGECDGFLMVNVIIKNSKLIRN